MGARPRSPMTISQTQDIAWKFRRLIAPSAPDRVTNIELASFAGYSATTWANWTHGRRPMSASTHGALSRMYRSMQANATPSAPGTPGPTPDPPAPVATPEVASASDDEEMLIVLIPASKRATLDRVLGVIGGSVVE